MTQRIDPSMGVRQNQAPALANFDGIDVLLGFAATCRGDDASPPRRADNARKICIIDFSHRSSRARAGVRPLEGLSESD